MDMNEYYKTKPYAYSMRNIASVDSRVANIVSAVTSSVPKGSKILDLGCGDLFLQEMLSEYEVNGLDIHSGNNPKIIEHNLASVPYPIKDQDYDAVICSEVIEHLFDPMCVLKEISRVLKPRGILVITVPNYDDLTNILNCHRPLLYNPDNSHTVEHIRQYNHQTLKYLLELCGLTSLAVMGNSPNMNSVLAQASAELRRFITEQYDADFSILGADQILGRMLPTLCPGFLIIAKNK